MESISLLGLLGICSFEDVRRRQIRCAVVMGFGILGVVFHLIFDRITIANLLGGMAVGAVLLLISRFTGERIGKGDGALLLVTGIYLGFEGNLILLWGSVTMMGLFCLAGLVTGRVRRGTEIPYVPFVLVCYVLILLFRRSAA